MTVVEATRPGPRGFFLDVGVLSASRAVVIASQVLILPIVARFLSFEDFALAAVAMSVVVFANVLSDAGLGRSLVRVERFDPLEWSSVFWFLAATGLALALAVVALAAPWERFFELPGLAAALFALSVVPLLQSLGAPFTADLERHSRFRALALVQATAAGLGLVAALALALLGAGFWALVAQQVTLAAARFVGLAAFSRFRPGLRFSWGAVRGHIGFGANVIGVSLVLALQGQAAVIAIGRVLGEAPLALWAMSDRVGKLPRAGLSAPFGQVVYVRMAQARRSRERLGKLYLASIRLLSLAILPMMAMLAACGEAAFTIILSPKWAEAAMIFALAAPGLAIETATSCAGPLFLAAGRADLRLRMAVERALLWIAILAATASYGVMAVAAARSLWVVLYLPRYWRHAGRCGDLGVWRCLGALAPGALAAAAGWGLHAAVAPVLGLSPIGEVALAVAEGVVVLALAVALTARQFGRDLALFRPAPRAAPFDSAEACP